MDIRPAMESLQPYLTDPRVIEMMKPIESHLEDVSADEMGQLRERLINLLSSSGKSEKFEARHFAPKDAGIFSAAFDVLECLVESFPLSEKDENLLLARMGIFFVDDRYPLGGLNRYDVAVSMQQVLWVAQMQLMQKLRQAHADDKQDIIAAIMYGDELQGAFCGEMANHACSFIPICKLNKREVEAEKVVLSDHCMVVVGRKADSDPDDISTWGENAVICDPWARKIYAASTFAEEQQKGDKIKMIRGVDFDTGKLDEHPDDYLAGTPKVERKITPF